MADVVEKKSITSHEIQANSDSEVSQMLNKAYIGMVEDGFKQLVKSAEAYAARDRLSASGSHSNSLVKIDGWQLFAPFNGKLSFSGQRGKDSLKGRGVASDHSGIVGFLGAIEQ